MTMFRLPFIGIPSLLAGMEDAMRLARSIQVKRPSIRYSINHRPSRSRYRPHQGKRECARRVRQMQKAAA